MFKGNELAHHIDHVTNHKHELRKISKNADKKLYLISIALLLALLALSAYWLVLEERKNDYVYGGAGYAQQ